MQTALRLLDAPGLPASQNQAEVAEATCLYLQLMKHSVWFHILNDVTSSFIGTADRSRAVHGLFDEVVFVFSARA